MIINTTTIDSFKNLYPFRLDTFQLQALDILLKGQSVMVTAPTGSGKTVIAEFAVHHALSLQKRVLYTTPLKALSNQKYRDFHEQYGDLVGLLTGDVSINPDSALVVMTTEILRNMLYQNLYRLHEVLYIIIDECHHVANENCKKILNDQIPFRLGLSATPENETDLTANNVLFDFFKEITPDEYGLSDAIRDGILNPYNYYPIISDLNKDEVKAFELILREILEAKIANDSTRLAQLYTQRDEFVDQAKTKLPLLQKLLTKIEDRKHLIVYCSGNSQLEDVAKIMKIYAIKFGIITANESTKDRKTMLEQFRKGYIQVLLSILILDEGIDIPAVKTAFILKSSARTRQSVQRRGRCLRLLRDDQGKVIQKNVSIYDFLVIPQEVSADKRITEINDELVNGEIMRIREFLSLAKNKKDAEQIINERRNIFN